MIERFQQANEVHYSKQWAIDWDRTPSRYLAAAGDYQAAIAKPAAGSGTAVLYLGGVLTQHGSFWGGTSTDAFGREFDKAIANPKVGTVLIEISSPGGDTRGTMELGSKIYAARNSGKRIVAHANSDAHSAAYWIGSAAHELYCSPSGSVGSIGVWTMHVDQSKMLKDAGYDVTLIYSGAHKVDSNPYAPLPASVRTDIQKEVDKIHQQFIGAVALHRGVSVATVASKFGQGKSFDAQEALKRGMVDGIGTFESIATAGTPAGRRLAALHTREQIQRMATGTPSPAQQRLAALNRRIAQDN